MLLHPSSDLGAWSDGVEQWGGWPSASSCSSRLRALPPTQTLLEVHLGMEVLQRSQQGHEDLLDDFPLLHEPSPGRQLPKKVT